MKKILASGLILSLIWIQGVNADSTHHNPNHQQKLFISKSDREIIEKKFQELGDLIAIIENNINRIEKKMIDIVTLKNSSDLCILKEILEYNKHMLKKKIKELKQLKKKNNNINLWITNAKKHYENIKKLLKTNKKLLEERKLQCK